MNDIQKTNTLITTLNRVQFVAEFFIFSKAKQNSDTIPQFLTVVEAIKFYLKSIAISQSQGIYLQSSRTQKTRMNPLDSLKEQQQTVDEEIKRGSKLLSLIKQKPYQSVDCYPEMVEKFSSGKKMQLITARRIPEELEEKNLNVMQVIGEILTILRPFISIICTRIYGVESYKPYLISLLIDLAIIFVFQKGLKVKNMEEKNQIIGRRKQMIKRYIFRKPFYDLVRRIIIVPLLAKIIKPERSISNLIMSLFDMQSSISLTL